MRGHVHDFMGLHRQLAYQRRLVRRRRPRRRVWHLRPQHRLQRLYGPDGSNRWQPAPSLPSRFHCAGPSLSHPSCGVGGSVCARQVALGLCHLRSHRSTLRWHSSHPVFWLHSLRPPRRRCLWASCSSRGMPTLLRPRRCSRLALDAHSSGSRYSPSPHSAAAPQRSSRRQCRCSPPTSRPRLRSRSRAPQLLMRVHSTSPLAPAAPLLSSSPRRRYTSSTGCRHMDSAASVDVVK